MLYRKDLFTAGSRGYGLLVSSASISLAGLWLVSSQWFLSGTAEQPASAVRSAQLIGLAMIAAALLTGLLLQRLSAESRGNRPKCVGSDRRIVARALQEREKHRHSVQAMHEALAVIGHELRTPLAGLRAIVEFILTEQDRNTPQVDEFLRSINIEIGRCSEMVNNMLEAARLDSGVAKWNWRRISLARVCEDAMEIVRPLASSKRLTFRLCVAPQDCSMMGDPDAIRRLILNLLTNSIKHTAEGEITVEVREASGPDHDWVQIRVRDTGEGISPELAQSLGRAFAANRGSVASQYVKGAGLGLAICREIVCAHGGRMTVTSSTSSGTTFTILLRADLHGPVIGERTEEPIPLVAA